MKNSGISSANTTRPPLATPTPDGFALTGPSPSFDPRRTAVRRDLADIRLADRYFAPHYAAPAARAIVSPVALREARVRTDTPLAELQPGETFELLDLIGDDGWGIAVTEGLVGYIDAAALGDPT